MWVATSKLAKFKSKFNSLAAKLSKGIAMPIALLPVAGLFLGISASVLNNLSSHSPEWVRILFSYFKLGGEIVFANLPLLFAVAIALAFAQDSGVAGFSAVVGWAVFNVLQSSLLREHTDPTTGSNYYSALFWGFIPQAGVGKNLGVTSLQSSIFGGILIGSLAAWCYNRYHTLKLPNFLGFFSGTRSVPLILLGILLPITLVFVMIWPVFALLLNYLGVGLGFLNQYGNVNSLIFGYVERSLIPFGVHHAFYAPLWYSSVGGEIALDAPALLGISTPQGYGVFKIIGANVNGHNISKNVKSWYDVLALLNPNADLNSASSASNWQGDNRYFQQLNAYMIGKQLHLEKIWGAKEIAKNLDYTLTYKSFSTSTFNRAAAVSVFNNEARLSVADVANMAKQGKLVNASFKPAFPSANIGAYQEGKYPFMIFGIPAAAAAMVVAAPKETRKETAMTVGSAALTSFLTGITEPFEFTFLFVSPLLFWGIHASLAAFSFWLTALLGANIGQTFSGGILDLIIYGFVPDISLGARANSYIPVLVGLIDIPLYFFSFLFMIKKFNLQTPGRGGRLIDKEEYRKSKKLSRDLEFDSQLVRAYHLVNAYGGADNIENTDACITKLRVTVKDPSKIDSEGLKKQGLSGTVNIYDNYAVAIFGTESDNLRTLMLKIIKQQVDVKKLKEFIEVTKPTSKVSKEETIKTKDSGLMPGESIKVLAPVAGKIVSLSKLEDESFLLLGKGIAIEPEGTSFKAPIKEGRLEFVFPAKHAYIFEQADLKIMVHVGIDSVKLVQGKDSDERSIERTFKQKLSAGDKVNNKEFLKVSWKDLDKLMLSDPKVRRTTPVIVLNEGLEGFKVKILARSGKNVKVGDPIFEIKRES